MRNQLMLTAAAAALLALAPATAQAAPMECDCDPAIYKSIAASKDASEFVFQGVPYDQKRRSLDRVEDQFQISKVWKGQTIEPRVRVLSRGKCSYNFITGVEYIVFAQGNPKLGYLEAGKCFRTRPTDDPQGKEDIKALGKAQQEFNLPLPHNIKPMQTR